MTLTGPTVWLLYEATSDPVLLFLLCNPSNGPGVVVVAGCPPPEDVVVVVSLEPSGSKVQTDDNYGAKKFLFKGFHFWRK